MGIIGGADGPTSIYVGSSIDLFVTAAILGLCAAAVVLLIVALRRRRKQKAKE
jgi:Na+-transporting methylmalonyl-CoA/oxaloacetate decarboxylase beta subunit